MISFNQSLSRFTLFLGVTLMVFFCVHYAYLLLMVSNFETSDIGLTYMINFILGIGITYGLYKLRTKYAHSLGFIFMGGSMFKFLVFFLAIQPLYTADGVVSGLEFGFFFIPYGVSLAFETMFISQILNETEF